MRGKADTQQGTLRSKLGLNQCLPLLPVHAFKAPTGMLLGGSILRDKADTWSVIPRDKREDP